MKQKDLAFIGIRILSLYIFTKALLGIGSLINLMTSQMSIGIVPIKQLFSTFLNSFGLVLLISLLLWIFADKISSLMIGKKESINIEQSQITLNGLQAIAISIVGLILFVNTIPEIIKVFTDYKFSVDQIGSIDPTLKSMTTFMFIEKITKLILGVALLIGGNKITKKVINH